MIGSRKTFKTILVFGLGLLVLANVRGADAKEIEIACRHRLRIIHEALSYYIEANDKMPDELGDLVGDYIQADLLRCPSIKTSGETLLGVPGLIEPSKNDGRVWAYKYEFSLSGDFNNTDTRGRLYKWLDFKKMQLSSVVGENVPIIRCDKHVDALETPGHTHINLNSSGKVFSSLTYWELMQVDKIPYEYLTPSLVEFAQKPLVEYMVQRSQQATPQMLNLRPYYNAMLEHPWIYGYWGAEMDQFVAKYPDGLFWNGEIGFDVAGVVQLCGKLSQDNQSGYTYQAYPKSKLNIQVDGRFSTLHIIGGVLFATDPGEEVAYMDILDENDNVMDSIPWVYGKDVVSIYADEDDSSLVASNYDIIWREELEYQQQPANAMLLHMRFSNTVSNAHVAKIHFRAGENVACPFIVGMSWVP